jgi:CHAT domain-containing protein/Tfp pilus assembly protein PilF
LETAFVVAETSGDYRLEVWSSNKEAKTGRYTIKIEELREATSRDRLHVSAQRAFEEANQLRDKGTAESLRRAALKYQESLPLWRTLKDRATEALTLNEIGFIHSSLGETQKALDYYGQALPLFRLVEDRVQEAGALNNIGMVYFKVGELQKALEYFGQSLQLKRAVGDQRGEANTLANMGVAYSQMGELQVALEHQLQALSLRRALGDKRGEALTLGNIGVVYSKLGEGQQALDYYGQALPTRRALKDRTGEAVTLYNLGLEYLWSGELQQALDYFNQSLPIRREVGDRLGEAYTLSATGVVYSELGEPQKALGYYQQALSLSQAVGDRIGEALTLTRLGLANSSSNKHDTALDYFTQALRLNQDVGNRLGEATALYNIARAERDLGRLNKAEAQIEDALNIIESIRGKVYSQESRASYLASKQNFYEFYTDLLMQMHQGQPSAGLDAKALQVSERRRARSLLDMLSEARTNIRQGVDPVLLERERSLQQQLSIKSERLTRLLGGKHTAEQESAARKEIEALLSGYKEVETQIRAKSPRYAALTQPQPLSLQEIQQQVLDDDTLLLHYALGKDRSFLWAVTPTSITSYVLPKRAEIEAASRRVYDLLVAKADALYPEALTTLSQMLLKPAVEQLGRKRLVIVCEGALQYIPFGALPIPVARGQGSGVSEAGGRGQGSEVSEKQIAHRPPTPDPRPPTPDPRPLPPAYRPLILNHEIVSLPSASVLAVLRRERGTHKSAPKTVAVLADPVFEKNDLRVQGSIKRQPMNERHETEKGPEKSSPISDVERSIRESGLSRFDRLVLSRREAELITALAGGGQPLKALDFAASRATATSPQLGQYQIVHFATHSLINNQHPELSGIVLSLVDKQGQPQDGFLRLYEVYNLKLEADLVVLSACQTALGKEIKGEGLIGLTRGFMYAGAPRVVASLWKVSDKATAELMKQFYQKMFKEGMRPAAALRAAQVSMLRVRQWQAAYYWAGFVLQGEWK